MFLLLRGPGGGGGILEIVIIKGYFIITKHEVCNVRFLIQFRTWTTSILKTMSILSYEHKKKVLFVFVTRSCPAAVTTRGLRPLDGVGLMLDPEGRKS